MGIGYVLYNGGDKFRSTTYELDVNSEKDLESCINLLPEYNQLTYEAFRLWIRRIPWVKHLLFCETGFFANLPKEARLYAVPSELNREGIKRFGGYGIYHHYVSELSDNFIPLRDKKIISIHLGKNTNIAAIKNGIPLDTTIGFTPMEGIFSDTGCGEIDPTVLFQLYSAGISFKEINHILSDKSGFTGLLGRPSTIYELLKNKSNENVAKVLKIFIYNILKYIGAYISLLNGVDLIIFIGNNICEFRELINEICNGLTFLGVNPEIDNNRMNKIIINNNSKIKLICLDINRWEIMNNKFLSMYNNIGVK
jgi:acetate kinase